MNKSINMIITILALVILVGTVFSLINNKDRNIPETTERVEIIDGKEVVLDHPLTESFSSEKSNRESGESKAQVATTSNSFTNYVKDTVVKPFTLGFYYLKNFTGNKTIADCTLLNKTNEEDRENIEYNVENFRLNNIQIQNKEFYLFVDADEVPKDLCAQVIQFKTYTSDIANAIHVIIN
jgi:hypothetical protein